MEEQFLRTQMLLGTAALEKLKRAHVAVFGVGGVGSFTVEALARAGVGSLTLVDGDTVAESNINRQLIALHSTVGMAKVEAAAARIVDINPDCRVNPVRCVFGPDTAGRFRFEDYSYVADAIDMVSGKLLLIERAKEAGVPVISCMGAGNKLDPARFEVEDIYRTSVCPLARVMRRELRLRGIQELKVVYSREEALRPGGGEPGVRKQVPGSVSFVPSAAGLILAGEIIKDLIDI